MELFGVFDHEYTGDGFPILRMPESAAGSKTAREHFEIHCRLNCVMDPATVAELWELHRTALAEKHKAAKASSAERMKKRREAGRVVRKPRDSEARGGPK